MNEWMNEYLLISWSINSKMIGSVVIEKKEKNRTTKISTCCHLFII